MFSYPSCYPTLQDALALHTLSLEVSRAQMPPTGAEALASLKVHQTLHGIFYSTRPPFLAC